VKAAGVVTSTKNWAADDTLLVGGVTYTLKADPTGTANDVDLGADEATTLANLAAAINLTGTAGVTYHEDTVGVPSVIATSGAHTLTITARFGGAWGNDIRLTEGTDSGTAYSVTTAMASGAGDISGTGGWVESLISLNQINSEVLSHLKTLTEASD
jgi:hypothetical protein